MRKILDRGRLLRETDGKKIDVGEIRRELDNLKFIYIIDLDKDVILKISDDISFLHTFMPGMDLINDGFYKEHDYVPYIVEMRVPDKRRADINEKAKQVGLTYYDEFAYFLKTGGRSLDEWTVEADLKVAMTC